MAVYITVIQVKALAFVIHHHKFKEQHNGFLNVYTLENQVDCSRGTAMNKDAKYHVASSQDMYCHFMDYTSLPILMYKPCLKVHFACATMLCRVAQSHLPTNFARVDTHPGIWRMILRAPMRTNFDPTTTRFSLIRYIQSSL
jgi:hypothetical protein